MSTLFQLLFFLLITAQVAAQCLQPLENGLIYKESTLQPLQEAIAALNNQDLEAFPSPISTLKQGSGFYVTLSLKRSSPKKRQAINQQLQQASLKDILQTYPSAKKKEVTILAFSTVEEGDSLDYYCEQSSSSSVTCIALSRQKEPDFSPSNKWVYQWKGHQLEAFYFPERLLPVAIPTAYQVACVYKNVLLDPATPLHLPSATGSYLDYRDVQTAQELAQLSTAQQQELLQKHRAIFIEIGCGADDTPCYHYLQIAQLAALTGSPTLFLQAHWAALENYTMVHELGYYKESDFPYYHSGTKELEMLDLNLAKLTTGLLLPYSQSTLLQYHTYQGILAINVAHSKDRSIILQQVDSLIKHPTLSLFHRQLAAHFYYKVLFAIPRKDLIGRFVYIKLFKKAIATLPAHFQQQFTYFPSTAPPRRRKEMKVTSDN